MKVLQVIYGLNIGGAETFIYNILAELEQERYMIDFVIQDNNITNKKLYDLCISKGCNIYVVEKFNRNIIRHYWQMEDIMSKGYDVIHIHANALINIVPIIVGCKFCENVILHSHSSLNNKGGIIGTIIHKVNRILLKTKSIKRVSCGVNAGKWMYGQEPFIIINNAIDVEKYKYNEDEQIKMKEKWGITDKTVIGHVGRFVEVKNHKFIITIYKKYVETNPNSVLVLVGDGPLKQEIQKRVLDNGLNDKVYFTGNVDNIWSYYNMFDCMIFPSIFEGLPFSLIEAQAAGVKVVASDRITTDVQLSNQVSYLSLDAPVKEWIKKLDEAVAIHDRLLGAKVVRESNYNIDNTMVTIRALYNN